MMKNVSMTVVLKYQINNMLQKKDTVNVMPKISRQWQLFGNGHLTKLTAPFNWKSTLLQSWSFSDQWSFLGPPNNGGKIWQDLFKKICETSFYSLEIRSGICFCGFSRHSVNIFYAIQQAISHWYLICNALFCSRENVAPLVAHCHGG